MDAFVVHGGRRLSGRVTVSGAKNSALKLVAAALLAQGPSGFSNVPDIADMWTMKEILEDLGARVDAPEPGRFTVHAPSEVGQETSAPLAKRLRASLVLLGPLLARAGRARMAMPGGCNLGNRNIDMHLSGLQQMGAQITYGPDWIEVTVDRLAGAEIDLVYASVGATENLMLAAVGARGTTVIDNAAREPEIVDLAGFLGAMGADISGAGSSRIVVRGVDGLHPASHRVVGDRIEAGTFAVAATLTGGDLEIVGVDPEHLRLPLDKLQAIGASVEPVAGGFAIRGHDALAATDIVTLPFPGCPTDLQPMFIALLSQAAGTSMVTENVYDGRFGIIGELCRLGAEIEREGHHAIIRGPRRLVGTQVEAMDLRAGAALVLAGLVAEGTTVVRNPRHVDRGYAYFAERLRAVAADVERMAVEPAGV